MKFVDANIFLRLLARDDMEKVASTEAWFRLVRDGAEEGVTSESVVAEVAHVLASQALYNVPRPEIAGRLEALLALPGLRIDHKSTIVDALDVYVQQPHMNFTDALTVAHARRLGITEILSYDRDFDRVGGITRVEP
jgi:predicted nucleic acid-binding protein